MEESVYPVLASVTEFLNNYPLIGESYTTIVRWIFPLLALFILIRAIRSLLRLDIPSETWAYLILPNGAQVPLNHWENVIGRARSSDIVLNYPSVSRSQATIDRDDSGHWVVTDLNSKSGTFINSVTVEGRTPVELGDTITVGGINLRLMPVAADERRRNVRQRLEESRPQSPIRSLIALTVFQVLTVIQLVIALGERCTPTVVLAFAGLTVVMWAYYLILRSCHQVGFEIEVIAFFLTTLSLAITASSAPSFVPKQLIAAVLGIVLFLVLGVYLRDLSRTKKIRRAILISAVVLLIINLAFGKITYGAQNWVSFGPFSFQPSELVKLAFIYVGAATMDELYEKRNLTLFMAFSAFCIGCLALMGDFGTASIFFVTFLVIAFLRSGDFSKLILILGGAVFAGVLVLRFKPYIAARFATWGHVWEFANAGGYQQVRTMSAGASGGLVGLGGGNGWLSSVAAADTDLVFGMLNEEWGLIIAILAVFSIITLCLFAVKSIKAGRSSFYTITACSATSLLLWQTTLNVLGSVDILPLTGVTFPFVSNGGTSMMVSWALLAFLKAADTRQNASFAIRRPRKRDLADSEADEILERLAETEEGGF